MLAKKSVRGDGAFEVESIELEGCRSLSKEVKVEFADYFSNQKHQLPLSLSREGMN